MFGVSERLRDKGCSTEVSWAFGEVVGWNSLLRGYKAASRFGCRYVTASLRAAFGWLSPLRYGCRTHSKRQLHALT